MVWYVVKMEYSQTLAKRSLKEDGTSYQYTGTTVVSWFSNVRGSINFQSQHPNSPPREMIKDGSAFDWNPAYQQAFEAIKDTISAETVLVYYGPTK